MNKTNSIQVSRFSPGGFVLHKITGDFSGKCSAWFDEKGEILAAEQIVLYTGRSEISRSVKKNGPIWEICASFGKRYVKN
jgi:hypothetical protein